MTRVKKTMALLLCSAMIMMAGKTAIYAEEMERADAVTGESVTVSGNAVSGNAVAVTGSAVTDTASDFETTAAGDKITKGNYVYTVVTTPTETESGTVRVSGLTTGATKKTSLTVPEKITANKETYEVTGIGKKAFTTSTALKKVTIKNNVTFIGIKAFQGLTKLETVLLPDGITMIKKQAFGGCTAIRTITLPTSLNLIGTKAFNNCSKLKAVVITSKKLSTVKKSAFNNIKSTAYFVIPSGKKAVYQSLLMSSGLYPTIYTF